MKSLKLTLISLFALLMAGTLAFTSCEKDKTTFNVDPTFYNFSFDGGEVSITIDGDWDMNPTTEVDWLVLTPSETVVIVTALPNYGYEERSAFISIGTATVSITQDGTPEDMIFDLKVSTGNLAFKCVYADSQVITVTPENISSWDAGTEAEWIDLEVNIEDNTVTVSVDNNEAETDRRGTIVFSSPRLTEDIVVNVFQSKYTAQLARGEFDGTYTAISYDLYKLDEEGRITKDFEGSISTIHKDYAILEGYNSKWDVHEITGVPVPDDLFEGGSGKVCLLFHLDMGYVMMKEVSTFKTANGEDIFPAFLSGESAYAESLVVGFDGYKNILDLTSVVYDNAYLLLVYYEDNDNTKPLRAVSNGYANLKLQYTPGTDGTSSVTSVTYSDLKPLKGQIINYPLIEGNKMLYR